MTTTLFALRMHSGFPTGTLLHRPLISSKIVSGIDERDVTERLRKITHLTPRLRIVLLGEEADVIPKG